MHETKFWRTRGWAVVFGAVLLSGVGCSSTNRVDPPPPKPAGDQEPPTPGPIIILQPREISPGSGTYNAEWSLSSGPVNPDNNTSSGFLRLDAFGKVKSIVVVRKNGAGNVTVGQVNLRIGKANGAAYDLSVKKLSNGYFEWLSGSTSLQACDLNTSPCLADCTNANGLPTEFFGSLDSLTVTGIETGDIEEIQFQADWSNPCPGL